VASGKAVIENEKREVLQKEYPLLMDTYREAARHSKTPKDTFQKKLLTRIRYRLHKHGIIKKL
jgi:predicted HicB family RNase H-like nuclease